MPRTQWPSTRPRRTFARARAGNGPTLIEAKAVRHRGHRDGDSQLYRTDKDDDDLVNYRDPLDVLRLYMSVEEMLRPGPSAAAHSRRPGSLSWEGRKRLGFRPFAQRL
ncbi:hypothetical protein KPA93_35600 [Burkholderia cenocepacia]|nr:hypothetical protein [Burkholderia cenocepacia]MDR8045779.1 hypothetical protein [Burkholderia cenocepacia]MDR8080474.1 hypothetical protein [Burkholderia cenocepacia]